ncbi:hypothetical protein [Gracilibacillus massiliensis]|uniref:hypothetical protein n=1 Tax=Gracilibacillus massiliensis TaxID=1564956 RepID=UPI00071E46F4|nr:hypothetical protein [Gracilibacillus massiliensis]
MAFDYGSDSLDIKNPFKKEGLLYLISGTVILLIGILSVFTLRMNIAGNEQLIGWFSLLVCLVLVSGGVSYIAKGLIKISRFYVGRGVPTSLSKNQAKSEKHTSEPSVTYQSQTLEQMIVGRKNPTFKEPVSLLERAVYSMFPKFIFLPYAMRNFINVYIRKIGYSLIGFLFYILALLSGAVGLTFLSQSSFANWMGIGLLLYLVVIWVFKPIRKKEVIQDKQLSQGRNGHIVWAIVLSILLPTVIELLLRQGITLPEAPFNPTFALVLFLLLMTLAFVASLLLTRIRADIAEPITETSEFREHWQENVHPKDFFRALDMEMMELRYKEIPNRIYRELNPNLHMEGSMDKGSFAGDTIQETQPVYQEMDYPDNLKTFRLGSAIAGHLFVVIAAFLLYFAMPTELSLSGLFPSLLFPLVLYVFGASLLLLAHLYWGEIQFKSYLIQFQGEGTYSESKLSVGMSYDDSTRSENTVVRTSYTTFFLVSQIISSTQAQSGANAFRNARYVISLNKADNMMDHLVDRIKYFLEDREFIASTVSKKDGEAMKQIFAINEAAASKQKLTDQTEKEKRLNQKLHDQ